MSRRRSYSSTTYPTVVCGLKTRCRNNSNAMVEPNVALFSAQAQVMLSISNVWLPAPTALLIPKIPWILVGLLKLCYWSQYYTFQNFQSVRVDFFKNADQSINLSSQTTQESCQQWGSWDRKFRDRDQVQYISRDHTRRKRSMGATTPAWILKCDILPPHFSQKGCFLNFEWWKWNDDATFLDTPGKSTHPPWKKSFRPSWPRCEHLFWNWKLTLCVVLQHRI